MKPQISNDLGLFSLRLECPQAQSGRPSRRQQKTERLALALARFQGVSAPVCFVDMRNQLFI
ncbi:hypothetical protein [Comamonas testosteroni]|uniref:hypothetical protein n=1 Tax=Comamonas testosteroni TaxID=285 RepID=UPI001110C8AE|nr:hypothetical protein [Comamonas testosteroni]QQN70689.1 hypothetical protein IYN88_04505 [Comamonas testosteroni]